MSEKALAEAAAIDEAGIDRIMYYLEFHMELG